MQSSLMSTPTIASASSEVPTVCCLCVTDVQSPFVVFVHEFCHTNSPSLVLKCSFHSFKVVWTASGGASNVVIRFVTDAEPDISRLVVEGKSVSLIAIHPQRVRFVNVGVWSSPVVVPVVEKGLDFFERFLNE